MSTNDSKIGRYDIVALVSNDLVTDQRMQKTLGSLQAAGYNCLLLGRERPKSQPIQMSWPFAQERHRLRAHTGKRFYLQLNLAHRSRLLELNPRLILAVDLDTVWAAHSAANRLGIPWVFDAHELFEEMPEVSRRWWIKAAWTAWGKLWVPKANGAYTVGTEIAKILSRKYHMPFGVVQNFPKRPVLNSNQLSVLEADLGARSGFAEKRPFIVLYQGALNEGRGLEELIGAAHQLPEVEVWIVGDGPEASRLQAFAKTQAAAKVKFFGELMPEALGKLTPRADLGYALMRNISKNYYLSLSNKSIDYIQAGLPSLQMNWPEYQSIQDEYGCFYLVDELSVEAVATAIRHCQSADTQTELRQGCLQASLDLVWENEEQTILQTVQAALK